MDLQSFLRTPVGTDLPAGVTLRNTTHLAPHVVYNSSDWLSKVFEGTNEALRNAYMWDVHENRPPSFTIRTINSIFKSLPRTKLYRPKFTIVTGLDALLLPLTPMAKNSIIQVASQFNGLEGTHPNQHSSLQSYPSDQTQGPRVVMPCAHALLKRESMYAINQPFNTFLSSMSEEQRQQFGLKHGYLQWGNDPSTLLRSMNDGSFVSNMLIMPMWCKPELISDSDHFVVQVPTAAPPVNAYGNTGPTAVQQTIAKILVKAQYRVLAKLAAIKSSVTGQRVALHLTFLGQGVFNNPPKVFIDSIQEVVEILDGHNVHVFLHAFSDKDANLGQQALVASGISTPSVVTAEHYLSMSPGLAYQKQKLEVKERRRIRRGSTSDACGIWNEVVDAVAPYFVDPYEPRCETVVLY